MKGRPRTPAETAQAWVEAANRQDGDGLVALSHPEVEVTGPRGAVRGAAVLRDWLLRAGLTLENRRLFARGPAVVIEQHGTWRDAAGAVVGAADVASRFTVEDGRVTAYERFDRLDDALAAAGLMEADFVA